MSTHLPHRRRFHHVVLGGLALPAILAHPPAGLAGDELPAEPAKQIAVAPAAPAVEVVKLDIPTCRRLGLEKQPALPAARASLAAAQARYQALESMHLAGVIRHDLAYRKRQACLGVQVSQALLTQAEWEAIYSITRTYVGVLYAQAQLKVADRALSDTPDGLPFLRNLAASIYKDRTRPDVKEWNVDQIEVDINVVRGRREEALEGLDRAKAGLREAMGVDVNFPIDLSDQKMPNIDVPVDVDSVIALALERRGEVSQTALVTDIVCLEVKAQGSSHHPKLETFAASADIHVHPAPQGVRNGEYRPGGINLEMPTEIVGSKNARVEQAQAYHARASAVNDKTRGLVSLEAKSAFLKWQETKNQMKDYAEARDKARQLYETLRGARGFDPKDKAGGKPFLDDLLNAAILASQTEVQANQAQYQHLLSLAALERVTAGGINPGFDKLAPVPLDNENGKK
jgi:outer membrane protein TolC